VFKEEEDLHTSEAYDQWLTAKISVERGGPPERATVIGRKKDHNGNPMGRYRSNALLDTRQYEIQHEDRTVAAVSSNIIAEGIYSAVDQEGRSNTILKSIQDPRLTNKAITKENGFTTNQYGVSRPKITTAGVELEVEWCDGSVSWVELKAMKEASPVETAEYAVASKSGARWRKHLAGTLREFGFTSCKADPVIWMQPGRILGIHTLLCRRYTMHFS
jgi:hypothetical protein